MAKPSERQTKRAAIYVRVSSDQQGRNYSLSTQEETCRAFAAERGYSVGEQHVYRETHTAAELFERPELTRLREAMGRREFDVLICFDPDRFSRNQVHTALLQHFCDRADVTLKFALFDFERSATGQFLLNARAFAAELELEKLRERTQRGKLARLRAGKLPAMPKPPYGYRFRDADKGALDVDEATAPIVQRIFAAIARGVSLHKLADELNVEGIPTPTGRGRWHHTSIQKLVAREAYIGVAQAQRTHSPKENGRRRRYVRPEEEQITLPSGTIPALVSREIFDAAQQRLARNKIAAVRNHRNPEAFLLRAGHICCGYCGKAIAARSEYRDSKGRRYPNCYRAIKHGTDCPLVWIDAAELDNAVWQRVYAILTDRQIIAREVAKRRGTDPTLTDRAVVERALADVVRQQANLARQIAMIDDESVAAPLMAELASLGERKRGLIAEQGSLAARYEAWQCDQRALDSLEAWCEKVAHGLEHATYERKRQALAALGVRVKLYALGHNPRWAFETFLPVFEDTPVDPITSGGRWSRWRSAPSWQPSIPASSMSRSRRS